MKILILHLLYVSTSVLTISPVLANERPILGVEGGFVQFDLMKDISGMDIDYMFWRFNGTHSVLRYSNESKNTLKSYEEYEGRVAMDPSTYALILDNLQLSDNGIYSAKITDHRGYEYDVAKHVLYVHEAVPDLQFTMTLLYINYTEKVCNVSVKCVAKDSWSKYTCDITQCYEEEVSISQTHLRMSISHGNNTVHCHASNLVSAKSVGGRITDVCTEEVLYSQVDSPLAPFLIVLDTTTPFFLIFLILFFLLRRRRHTGEFTTTVPLKKKYASIELLQVYDFQEFYKSPYVLELPKGDMMNMKGGVSRSFLPQMHESMGSFTLERL